MRDPTVHADAFALAAALLAEIEEGGRAPHRALRERLSDAALRLAELVTLALTTRDAEERHLRVLDADAALAVLRLHLRLARALDVLAEDAFLAFAEQSDCVGRQLGGWLRKLSAVS